MTTSPFRTTTPPALKWLLTERAALEGSLLHAQKTVGLLQKRIQVLQGTLGRYEESVRACQAGIAALDVSVGLLHPEIGGARPAPVNAWQGKYGARGSLRAFVLEKVREAAPAPVLVLDVTDQLAAQFGVAICAPDLHQRLLNSVRDAPRKLAKQGLVERAPTQRHSTEPGLWRLRQDSPLDQLRALARAQESGHDPPVDPTGGEVDRQ